MRERLVLNPRAIGNRCLPGYFFPGRNLFSAVE